MEVPFEDCDDGNKWNGDGCSAVCTRETNFSTRFLPILVNVSLISFPPAGYIPIAGHVVYTTAAISGPGPQPPIVALRALEMDATGIPQTGLFCLRGVVPPDEHFGPGNVGLGTRGTDFAPRNALNVRAYMQQWVDPLVGTTVDVGVDGVPCTEDDPAYSTATVSENMLTIPLPPTCNGDANADGKVTVDEIITAVNNALDGCSQ